MSDTSNSHRKTTLGAVCEIIGNLVDPCLPAYSSLSHVGGANIVSHTGELINLKTAQEEELISGKYLFTPYDVLYSKIRPYLRKVALPEFTGLCSADIYPLRPKLGEIRREYLGYLLLSDQFTEYANRVSNRAGMPKINREQLFAYEIELVGLEAQDRILACIRTMLERVEKARGQRDNANVEAQYLLRSLRRGSLGSAEVVPVGWSEARLGSVADVIYGISAPIAKNRDPSLGPPIIRMANLSIDGELDLSDLRYMAIPKGRDRHFLLQRGDLLLNWRSGSAEHVGKTALFDEAGDFTCASFILRIRANPGVANNRYLRHVLNFMRAERIFQGQSRMQINSKLNSSEFSAFPIRFPATIEKQEEVADRLDAAESLVRAIRNERSVADIEYGLLSQAILRKAFAGEL